MTISIKKGIKWLIPPQKIALVWNRCMNRYELFDMSSVPSMQKLTQQKLTLHFQNYTLSNTASKNSFILVWISPPEISLV